MAGVEYSQSSAPLVIKPSSTQPPATASPVSVAIVEDQTIVRELMASFLAADPSLRVVVKTDSGEAFFRELHGKRIDLAILDIALPDGSGIDILARLKKMVRQPKVLMVTAMERALPLQQAMAAGADGLVSKGAPVEHLRAAVRTVLAGGIYVDPIAVTLLKQSEPGEVHRVTARERQIAIMVARGLKTRQIAGELGISEKTVTNHRTALMRKIHARNSADITRFAAAERWI